MRDIENLVDGFREEVFVWLECVGSVRLEERERERRLIRSEKRHEQATRESCSTKKKKRFVEQNHFSERERSNKW